EEGLTENERDDISINKRMFQKIFIDEVRGLVGRHPEKLQQFFEKAIESLPQDMVPFFELFISAHPLEGIAVFHEYTKRKFGIRKEETDSATNKTDSGHDRSGTWFIESVETAGSIAQNILNFFDTWKTRCVRGGQDGLSVDFLEHWKQEELLKTFEYLSYATRQALDARAHGTTEECAPIFAFFPAQVPRDEFLIMQNRIKNLFKPPEEKNLGKTFYEQIGDKIGVTSMLSMSDQSINLVNVPIIVNVLDARDALHYLNDYWNELSTSMDLESIFTLRKQEDMVHIRVGPHIVFSFRDTPVIKDGNTWKQARIRIRGDGPLVYLSKRVDLDTNGLTLDDGGAHFDEAYAYAKEVRSKNIEAEIAHKEAMKRHPKKMPAPTMHFHPSIMKNDAQLPNGWTLSPENKIALFSTIVMQAGSFLGMRKHFAFSNHSREFISDKSHAEHFPEIVAGLLSSLLEPSK
ncbi:MAG: hypothetical protein Q8P56_01275, partial [Candidatus Uhrbacteria bacterium]|nr:hypothetical protein [Candidatus Uhrbacteria bacterium]